MNSKINILAAVLVVQLLLVGTSLIADGGADGDDAHFLQFDAAVVTQLQVTEGDNSVALTRGADGWSVDGYPADADKVKGVLDKFADMRAAWPVATTSAAAERFEVTDDNHQRQLRLLAGDDDVAHVYLGTSPGYRRVHARVAGADDVFSINFSNFELPGQTDEWLARKLLAADGDVTGLALADAWQLRQGDEGWLLGDAAADQDAASSLAERVQGLSVTGLSSMDTAAAESKGALTVTDSTGDYTLQWFRTAEPDEYAVRTSRRDGLFTVATYVAEQIIVTADDLMAELTEAEAAP